MLCLVASGQSLKLLTTGQGDRHSDGLINHMAILLDSITASPESIFVFAATNRPDIIEPALLRPGLANPFSALLFFSYFS